MRGEKITVWITKYTLTTGIMKTKARECGDGMVVYRRSAKHFEEYCHKGEWFTSESDAKGKAEEMRTKKIRSLEKKLNQVKAMEF